jgi:Tfp pilus assembly protein PilZ
MPCAVHVEGRRYSGVVLNVSQGGLFIQTSASPGRGDEVEVELNTPEAERSIPVQGKVVWRRVVPHQLRSMARGGMGVQIQRADESYYMLLARWMRTELPVASPTPSGPAAGARASADSELPSWRVRVRAVAGPRTRTLTLEAESSSSARELAMTHVGEGWRVLLIEKL